MKYQTIICESTESLQASVEKTIKLDGWVESIHTVGDIHYLTVGYPTGE